MAEEMHEPQELPGGARDTRSGLLRLGLIAAAIVAV